MWTHVRADWRGHEHATAGRLSRHSGRALTEHEPSLRSIGREAAAFAHVEKRRASQEGGAKKLRGEWPLEANFQGIDVALFAINQNAKNHTNQYFPHVPSVQDMRERTHL